MDVHETIERWRESIPESSRVEAVTGVGVLALGLAASALTLVRRRTGFFAFAVPGALLAAGLVMLADVVLDVRGERIDRTTLAIRAELEDLDPLARAQVLREVAREELEGLVPGGA